MASLHGEFIDRKALSEPTKHDDENDAFLRDVFDEGPVRIGKPGEMERLQKAKTLLEGWRASNEKLGFSNGNVEGWLEEVEKLIHENEETNKKRKEAKKAGRRSRRQKRRVRVKTAVRRRVGRKASHTRRK